MKTTIGLYLLGAVVFGQAIDLPMPGWVEGITQVTGWGILGWLVWHTHSRTLPKQATDFTAALDAERRTHAEELAAERKTHAEELSSERKTNTDIVTKIIDTNNNAWEHIRDRLHKLADSTNVLSAKVEVLSERHRQVCLPDAEEKP